MALTGTILVVDDEKNIREGIKRFLEMEKHEVFLATNGQEAFEILTEQDFDVVITDLKMPILSGEKLLEKIMALKPYIKVMVLTGHGTIENAVEAMKKGAYDFFSKPVNTDKLIFSIQRALKEKNLTQENFQLKQQLSEKYGFENIIGSSDALKNVMDIVKQIAPTKASVLIEGESGTGKELVANAIHYLSESREGNLVKVHCAALNENLLESELFGHEKGAFTGAMSARKGRFEMAHGGTLFLDEIGEVSPMIQVKLLRALQEREFERVGGNKPIKVDVRIISATNRDLQEEVEKGNFREDLFYRLKVVALKIPSLRERKSDIPLLVDAFLKEFTLMNNKPPLSVSPKTMALLESYHWPGNIRELRNAIEGAVVLAKSNIITDQELPHLIRNVPLTKNGFQVELGLPLSEVEKKYILASVEFAGGNKSKAARLLEIGRKTLHRKLDEYEG